MDFFEAVQERFDSKAQPEKRSLGLYQEIVTLASAGGLVISAGCASGSI